MSFYNSAKIFNFHLHILFFFPVYAPIQHYLPKAIRDLPPLNDKEYVDRVYADAPLKPYCLPPVRNMKKRVVYWVHSSKQFQSNLSPIIPFKLVEYEPLLDSSDMTFDDWIRIAKVVTTKRKFKKDIITGQTI
jgi:lysophospholipase